MGKGKNSSLDKACRIAFLALFLRDHPYHHGDSRALAALLGTTLRTVQRDLNCVPAVLKKLDEIQK